jgi:HEAT repeat protein
MCCVIHELISAGTVSKINNLEDKRIDLLVNGNEYEQEKAKKELAALGKKAIPILKKYLTHKEWVVRRQIVRVLSEIKGNESTDLLQKIALEDERASVRINAVRGLRDRKIKDDVIIKLLNDKNKSVQILVFDLINVDKTSKSLIRYLIKRLRIEKDWGIKRELAEVLGKVKTLKIETRVNLILNELEKECRNPTSLEFDEDSYAPITECIKCRYRIIIEDIGTSAIPFLKKRMKKSKGEFKQRLVITLGFLKEQSVYSDLINILTKEKDGWLRAWAARALGILGNKNAIPFLKEALKDEFFVIPPKLSMSLQREYKYYAVRSEAWSALLSLGVDVQRVDDYKFRIGNEYFE